MDALLNTPLGPELLRIAITGSFFLLGLAVGWLLSKWRRYRQLHRPSEARRARS